ncbi:MAG: AAA family ATPase [Bacteroidetes bacterium SB0662_bin_6]|nr:AAA family ATPase [Bacteroidetes bacterium SB0662_bin_6]
MIPDTPKPEHERQLAEAFNTALPRKLTREQIDEVREEYFPHVQFVACLGNKKPVDWRDPENAADGWTGRGKPTFKPMSDRAYERAALLAVFPSSMRLVGVDVDYGGRAVADQLADLYPYATYITPSRRPDGWHVWFAVDTDVFESKDYSFGGGSGQTRGSENYLICWDPEGFVDMCRRLHQCDQPVPANALRAHLGLPIPGTKTGRAAPASALRKEADPLRSSDLPATIQVQILRLHQALQDKRGERHTTLISEAGSILRRIRGAGLDPGQYTDLLLPDNPGPGVDMDKARKTVEAALKYALDAELDIAQNVPAGERERLGPLDDALKSAWAAKSQEAPDYDALIRAIKSAWADVQDLRLSKETGRLMRDYRAVVWDTVTDLEGSQLDAEIRGRFIMPARPHHHAHVSSLMDGVHAPVDWVVDGWIPSGMVSLLGGHGEVGKSFASLWLCMRIALGEVRWFDVLEGTHQTELGTRPPEVMQEGRVLYAGFEDTLDTMYSRVFRKFIEGQDDAVLEKVRDNVCVLRGTSPLFAPLAGKHRDTQLRITEAGRIFEDAVKTIVPRLVVIDPIVAAFSGNISDSVAVRAFIRFLQRLAEDTGAAILMVGHLPKGGTSTARSFASAGSADWQNGSRAAMTLMRDVKMRKNKAGEWVPAKDPDGRVIYLNSLTLRLEKGNHARRKPDLKLWWGPDAGSGLVIYPHSYGGADSEPTNGQTAARPPKAPSQPIDDEELPF